MTSVVTGLKRIAWYKWLIAFFMLLYLIYIALSYLYLPDKLKNITETDVSGMIGRKISVSKIEFNPFKLALKITDLSIADEPERPLVSWNEMHINFGFWKSLFSWGIALNEFRLDRPLISITKQGDRFNFSDIIERLTPAESVKDEEQEAPAEKTSIVLLIHDISINDGVFNFVDMSGRVPARSNLENITIAVKELYLATGDEHLNTFNLNAVVPGGGQIDLAGSYRIDPLYIESDIRAVDIDIPVYSGFLENIIPVTISRGRLFFNAKMLAQADDRMKIDVNGGNISIKELVLDDDVADPSMLTAREISINGINVDLLNKNLTADGVLLNGLTASQWIDEKGVPRYERLMSKKESVEVSKGEQISAEEETGGQPWNILLKQVSLTESTVNFEDRNEGINSRHSLSGINLGIRDVTLTPGRKMPLQLTAMLDQEGKIIAEGSLVLSPLNVDFKYRLENILLQSFSEYIEAASHLKIDRGNLNIEGSLSIDGETQPSINALASVDLNDLKITDTRTGSALFRYDSLKIADITADVDKKRVSVASITLSKPEVSIELSEKKEINLAGLMKQKEEGSAESLPSEGDGSDKWALSIDKISIREGTAHYSDRSVKPSYKTGLYNMEFSLNGVASDMKDPAVFSFKADIDKYAPFIINGKLDPLDRQPGFEFTSTLKGLEMPHLSPYSAVFIGNNLKSGKLDLKLDYSLHDRKLNGKNNVIAKNLYLGDKVPGEPVIDAPVGLGLALLRDISGVIDLDLGISGDLDDPGFSVSGIIIKVIVNVFVKAAASPFKLLGALIPGGSEDMGDIRFEPGISILNQESKSQLEKLVEALNQRPQLMLNIKGSASKSDDVRVLKLIRIKQRIADHRGIDMQGLVEELEGQKIWMIEENRNALEKMNDDNGLLSLNERIEELRLGIPETPDLELQTTAFEKIFEDLLQTQEITEDELLSLAEQRALSIKQHLIDELKLGHERVSVIKAHSIDLTGSVIRLDIDAM